VSSDAIKPWRHIFGGQRGYLCLFSGYRTEADELEDTESRYFVFPDQTEEAARYATEESAAGREAYFCAHLLHARRRVKENAEAIATLWCELDGAEVPNGKLKPTAVVESSPGHYHVYWRLTDMVSPEVAERLNRKLAHHIGADTSGFDLTQLLRVPGTVNYKYEDRPVVRLLDIEPGRAYAPAELDELLPPFSQNGHLASRDGIGGSPVVLDAEGMKVWCGEKPKLKADRQVDRSASLMKIGRVLYDAGANRAVIVDALRERDAALGWRCYTDRADADVRYQEIVDELEKNGRNARLTFGEKPEESAGQKDERCNQADRLIGYALEDARALFVDQHGAPHALRDGEPVPLNSRCYSWLRRLMWQQEERAVNGEYLKTAAGTLAAHAEFSGDVRELHTRAAWYEDALYYELGPGRVIKVSAGGWGFESNSPVLFRRFPNLKPLPDPGHGASVEDLAEYANLKTNRDKRLFTAYAVTLLLPHVGRPILSASGAMGSGKTTLGRLLKRLLDPTAPETVRFDPRDFLQKASHAYIVMLDNQNTIPEWAADTLCRLVTGEADSKRRLYTDDEDVIIELRRAVLLNGINVPTDRGDVLDRSLVVELERIPDGERRTEEELWERFETEHPKLLGALFSVLAEAIALKPSLKLSRRPRLADWGEYAAAVYEIMGWGAEQFLEDWDEVVKVQNQATLDGSPVAQAIIKFMQERSEYTGTSSELHSKLKPMAATLGVDVDRDKAWPKSARWLWRRIKEVLPLLVAAGIEARRLEDRSGSKITLRKAPKNDATNATEGGNPITKPKTDGNSKGSNATANATAGESNATGGNTAESNATPNTTRNVDTYADSGNSGISGNRSGGFSERLSAFLQEPPPWYIRQAEECAQQGAPKRLLKPLAAAVAYHVLGNTHRWPEILPHLEAALKEGGVA
jgi:energy-coupling factor transporter ATP-binding protein EcfA2